MHKKRVINRKSFCVQARGIQHISKFDFNFSNVFGHSVYSCCHNNKNIQINLLNRTKEIEIIAARN